jgi:hypothetical protein
MPGQPNTPEEAIWDIHARMISLETTIRGTPNTAERGLVGVVEDVKALAVEVKDANIDQGKTVAWLMARCRAFHGESNTAANPGNPGTGDKANPLAGISKGRVVSFLVAAATFVALVIYTLGQWVGWWSPPPPNP